MYRPLRFVNGLQANGVDPVVVSFAVDENLKKVINKFDYGLENELRKDVTVYRVPLEDMTKFYETKWKRFKNIYFNVTDNYLKAWRKNFYEQLPAILQKHKPDAVMVTCPPFSAAVLSYEISKKYSLPLILDMRDAWAKLSIGNLGSRLHYWYKKNLEKKVFKQAAAIITVTPQLKDIFVQTHPEIAAEKFKLIPNSFEGELREDLDVCYKGIRQTGACHFGYVGAYYYSPAARDIMMKAWWKRSGHRMLQYAPVKEDWLYRSPYFF
ncbi:MAG TPA: glycosyltransferase, partial [Ferruginibacter sp.]|nr:glycosyltransferase [Ferruginibacter sp.]